MDTPYTTRRKSEQAAKSFENTALLPEAAERLMADATLDGRCDPQFILDLRKTLLSKFSIECPVCKGTGIATYTVRGKINQSGCDTCHGSGKRRT